MSDRMPPDQLDRDRIEADLDTNLLVEAGAGSGKTHSMVGRMVALVRTGTATVDEVAAVTFTRKAAGELRERFQERLEQAYAASLGSADSGASDRLRRALAEIDRCFTGTIHAFCGRLLRERPLEAGVSPEFREISGPEEDRFRAESWVRFLERLGAHDARRRKAGRRSRLPGGLAEVGLLPSQLQGLFREVSGNPDVHYPAPPAPRPAAAEIDGWRRKLGALLDATLAALPEDEPAAGWDKLQNLARTLRRTRFYPGWEGDAAFLDALADAVERNHDVTLNRWPIPGPQVKALRERWDEVGAEDGAARSLVRRWQAYRYPLLLRFARTAAAFYAAERVRAGRLNFQDLLMLTARLLRTSRDARQDLGTRYRRLLVDEFQDTDPVQAEVVFLLGAEDGSGDDWTRVAPRPGALFVVGDPKQSIYRFRRADIAVYNQVKARFHDFGAVLELTANFRSSRPIEELVERVFRDPALFPDEETPHQAKFAPLRTVPENAGKGGVHWYGFEAPGKGQFSGARIAAPDARCVASWIAGEIAAERHEPGDFMVLTRSKGQLTRYAAELEARGVALQVSGAGIGMQAELEDLVLLLQALIDPADGVRTVSVLEGVFFGVSHAELFEHVRLGGSFDVTRAEQPEASPVRAALTRMHRFWRLTRWLPADAAVAQIVEELGILPHAVAGELGSTRAGALLYALDALRLASLEGECSLPGAVEVLTMALQQEVDTPLIPGRTDVVRLMNLHKAKGLEAKVVVLAYPAKSREHAPVRHVTRGADGRAVGYLLVSDSTRRGGGLLAAPLDWERHAAAEQAFAEAEDVRLLYVAATRAAEQLVVARCPSTESGSDWEGLHAALDDPALARELAVEMVPPVARPLVEAGTDEIELRIADVERRRDGLRRPSYRGGSVTARVKTKGVTWLDGPEVRSVEFGAPQPAGRGAGWGRAVHRAIEFATRGADAYSLRHACRGFLLDEEDRETDNRGEPTELDELVALIESLRRSPLWRRATAATERLVEVPFTLTLPAAEAAAMGLLPADAPGQALEVVEGVIDLAFREPGGWVIADYKTDAAPSAQTSAAYRAQVDAYAACWERITGTPVNQRVIFYTVQGREETW
jgi:ATP-dependent helicase/nuclease subunit A